METIKFNGGRDIPLKLNVTQKKKITCNGSGVCEVKGSGQISWVLLLCFVYSERERRA